jgi:hypothetical protein
MKMAQLLYQIPTKAEDWIGYRDLTDEPPTGSISEVRVMIAGMPLIWKLINMAIVVFPKTMLWKLTVETGITFLMETSAIDDMIINSVALTFILNIDEMLMAALMHEEECALVEAVEEFPLYDPTTSCVGDMSLLSENELIEKYNKTQVGINTVGLHDLSLLLPYKLLISLLGTYVFVEEYYWKNCTSDDQGGIYLLVSKPMQLPKCFSFDWLNAFLPLFFPVPSEDEPYWTMPSD